MIWLKKRELDQTSLFHHLVIEKQLLFLSIIIFLLEKCRNHLKTLLKKLNLKFLTQLWFGKLRKYWQISLTTTRNKLNLKRSWQLTLHIRFKTLKTVWLVNKHISWTAWILVSQLRQTFLSETSTCYSQMKLLHQKQKKCLTISLLDSQQMVLCQKNKLVITFTPRPQQKSSLMNIESKLSLNNTMKIRMTS